MTDQTDMPAGRKPHADSAGEGVDDAYASELDRAIAASEEPEEPAAPPAAEESAGVQSEDPNFQLRFDGPAGEPTPPEAEVEKERNRNLSPIVESIQDEGPPRPTTPRRQEPRPTPPPLEPAARMAPPPPAATPPSLGVYVALGAAAVALLVAVALGFNSASLERRLAALENETRALAQPASDPRIESLGNQARELRRELAALEERVSARPAEPVDGATLDTFKDRLATQEQTLADLTERVESLQPPAKNAAKPAAPKPAAATPVAPPTTASAPTATGRWSVNLITMANSIAADRLLAKYRKAGVEAERQTVTVKGKTLYRLRVPGFANSESAKSYAAEAKTKLDLKDIWITRD